MSDAACEREAPSADGHGDAEESCLTGQGENVRVSLRHVPTLKLKAALLTTAVHVVRCGGEKLPGVTASSIRNATRCEVLRSIVAVHSRSEDDSQMLGIAIEHALN
eukprot:jgi/Tetstr1/456891/TSEL_043561.t1